MLYEDLLPDYEAFVILNKRRTEFGSIPMTEILAYMQINKITDYEERELFMKRIEMLDNIYLKWREKQNG